MKFYRSIAPLYDFVFPLNAEQVTFVQSYLGKAGPEESSLLDVGCATGNLALACADDSVKVTGMDLDEEMIALAKKKEGAQKLRFMDGNMMHLTRLFKANEFDCVTCFGNTIVHLSSMEDISSFFNAVYHVLKKDGVFLGQIIHYNRIFSQDIHALPTIDNEHIRFVRDYHFKPSDQYLEFKTSLLVKSNEQIMDNSIMLMALKKDELHQSLSSVGFSEICFWGGFNKASLESTSQALVFAAYK